MVNTSSIPSIANSFAAEQAELLLKSFQRLTGRSLIPDGLIGEQRYKALFDLKYPVLSHNAEGDPKLNYSNAVGMEQFEISWDELIKLPSRYTAEPQIQEERDRLLRAVTENGFIDDYQGVRVSAEGNRFFVEDAIVWNIVDDAGNYFGQAAVLYKCRSLST